jgi:hypothetical protein
MLALWTRASNLPQLGVGLLHGLHPASAATPWTSLVPLAYSAMSNVNWPDSILNVEHGVDEAHEVERMRVRA